MGMAGSSYVICNRCGKDITSKPYPNENWCPGCEPVQMRELRERIRELEAYKSAFFFLGAEIAKAGCCVHPPWDGETEFNPGRCVQDSLMRVFLSKRRALKGEQMTEYADRDTEAQADDYARHVSAMTRENLHDKAAIAAELAHRDIRIRELEAENERLREAIEKALDWSEYNEDTHMCETVLREALEGE